MKMKSGCSIAALGITTLFSVELGFEVGRVSGFVTPSGPSARHGNAEEPLNVLAGQDEPVGRALLSTISEKIGVVQDERIIYPEYESGEVPRLFSSLAYSKSDQGTLNAVHATGSVLGATALIAGTTVGAGILALPAATAPVGFLPSTAAMGIGWAYMTMSGLLIAELSINRLGQSGKPGQGMLDLYEDSLGPNWSKVGSASYFFLHYAVVVAYIAQGGVNLDGLLKYFGLSDVAQLPGIGQALFASICASGLFVASKKQVEKVNNVFVLVLAAAFTGIICLGAQTADFSSLTDLSNQHPELVVDAFPIIFLSLVFQNVVPTVVNQLEGDRSKITKAIISGTTFPTLMFVAWNAVVLGNVQGEDLANIDPVALLQSAEGDNALLGTLVGSFSFLAIITSLIGFTYALLDAWTDTFRIPQEGPEYEQWKPALFALIFLPPLALSVTDPNIFYSALDYGGAFGVSTLFLVLPPLMVWAQRYGDEKPELLTKPMVPFGKIPLASMWKAAGTLIIEQGADKLGFFDWISNLISLPSLPS
jgi:tyrosine-specific transport protein